MPPLRPSLHVLPPHVASPQALPRHVAPSAAALLRIAMVRVGLVRVARPRLSWPRRLAALLVAGATVGAAAVEPARLPGPPFPAYASPAALQKACDDGLRAADAAVRRLERRPTAGAAGAAWLRAWDDLNALSEDRAGPIYLLSNVHPDAAIRAAAEACELRWGEWQSALGQNDRLYRAARAVQPRDAVDRHFRRTTLEGFEDAGVGLQGAARARAKAITDRLTALSQAFDKQIRDAGVELAFTETELDGVAPAVWQALPRDAEGRVRLTLDYPVYQPVMQDATVAATRRRMWRAKTDEGGDANLVLLAEIARLRHEYAALFGQPSYAHFALRRRMAERPEVAEAFLADVQRAVAEREHDELRELRRAKAALLGVAEETVTVERWDVNFLTERVKRERYAVDQNAFKRYFPPQQGFELALRVVERLFGVRYTRVPGAALWHPDVQAWAVTEAAGGKALATLYVDLYPRPGKYNHAAVWSFRSGAAPTGRLPQAALVVNLDRAGLTLDEMETLLHELGHAVHGNLSATRYASQAGTSTQRDFVEAPSQMLEDWVYDRRVLDLMAAVCPRCDRVPDELLAQARRARRYGEGVRYARQQLYAGYDLALHGPEVPDPLALWARLESLTPLGHVAGSRFPAGFAHIAGGYAAGYYGYLWSEVVAADLRTAFAADKLDARVGQRYRQRVLAQGGQRPPRELVRDFLGRDTDSRAFYEQLRRLP